MKLTTKTKTMKYFLIAIIVLLSACKIETQTEYKMNNEEAYLAVGTDATKEMMTSIAEEFEENKSIELDFSKSKFDEEGKIEYLNLMVKTGGVKGGVESDFTSVSGERPGFQINFNTEEGTTLSTGLIH